MNDHWPLVAAALMISIAVALGMWKRDSTIEALAARDTRASQENVKRDAPARLPAEAPLPEAAPKAPPPLPAAKLETAVSTGTAAAPAPAPAPAPSPAAATSTATATGASKFALPSAAPAPAQPKAPAPAAPAAAPAPAPAPAAPAPAPAPAQPKAPVVAAPAAQPTPAQPAQPAQPQPAQPAQPAQAQPAQPAPAQPKAPPAPGGKRDQVLLDLRKGLEGKLTTAATDVANGGYMLKVTGAQLEVQPLPNWSINVYNMNPQQPDAETDNFKVIYSEVATVLGADVNQKAAPLGNGKTSLQTSSKLGSVSVVRDQTNGISVVITPNQQRKALPPVQPVQPPAQPKP